MYEMIDYEVREGIATIALDRPEKLNAYTPEMGEEAVAAFERARIDADAKVVILTGRGRAFCAGVDLDRFRAHMLAAEAGEEPPAGLKLGEEAFVRTWPVELVAYPKPVIAAINGAAYGVGVTMTLGCDVRIAARSAVLGKWRARPSGDYGAGASFSFSACSSHQVISISLNRPAALVSCCRARSGSPFSRSRSA